VLTAQGGREAIELYRLRSGDIRLVILDMIMPGMGGGETFDQLRLIRPDVKVLLASGYSINGQAREIMERGCMGFIQKPFSVQELSLKVRDALAAKETGQAAS
jgi:DNA-binding NtrC family response regulator